MTEKKYIRFIDSHYKTLFHIADGTNIIVTHNDGKEYKRPCRYVDEYHTKIGEVCYHICEWAEIMERNGGTYRPEQYILDLKFYPRRYLYHVEGQPNYSYYIIDETQSHCFAYAPKSVPGRRYCIVNTRPGDTDSDLCFGEERIFSGTLKALHPQKLGFNMEKIKAIISRKPKARQGHER